MIHYLDCNATTPIDPRVAALVRSYMEVEFGNAGSRTHIYGINAKVAVERAREQIAKVVDANLSEIIFTSGATESNNLAILGMAEHLIKAGKNHIITTSVEHKAVLEPIAELQKRGFQISHIDPDENGNISVDSVLSLITDETGLISIMHANNETGAINPIASIADRIIDESIFFHVDAAQSFAKLLVPLKHKRIDLISVSSHKMYGPKGIGALIARRRSYKRPPLTPILYGGGQERGLRAGTLPVALIAGMGEAARILSDENDHWTRICLVLKENAIKAFEKIDCDFNGDPEKCLPNTINVSIRNLNSEAAILLVKDLAAISNGSACTSKSYSLSHVLTAMGYEEDRVKSALRISWSHMTENVPWRKIVARLSIAQ